MVLSDPWDMQRDGDLVRERGWRACFSPGTCCCCCCSVTQSCPALSNPMDTAHQASLPFTLSRSLLKLMSIELVMPSNHLILCRPLLLPPSIFPSIRVFSNESAFHIRWPNYWALMGSDNWQGREGVPSRDLAVREGVAPGPQGRDGAEFSFPGCLTLTRLLPREPAISVTTALLPSPGLSPHTLSPYLPFPFLLPPLEKHNEFDKKLSC